MVVLIEALAFRALCALVPIVLALVLMVGLQRPAFQAMPLAWLVSAFLAGTLWRMPITWIAAATIFGALNAITILIIVFGALLLLNTLRESGAVYSISSSLLRISTDRRVQALLIAFGFATLVEGAAGFGTPAALAGSLLVGIGFPPLIAAASALIGHSCAVSFGAAGTPVIGGIGTALNVPQIREALPVPFVTWITKNVTTWNANFHFLGGAIIVPILVVTCTTVWSDGWRSWKKAVDVWPLAIVTGIAFAVTQNLLARLIGPELPSIGGGLVAMLLVVWLARQRWLQPKEPWDFSKGVAKEGRVVDVSPNVNRSISSIRAWLPYFLIVVLLLLSRMPWLPFRKLLMVYTISWPKILGTELDWNFPVFYNSGLFPFIVVALIGWGLFHMSWKQVKKAVIATARQVAPASVAMVAAVAMAQVMMQSGHNALKGEGMLASLAEASARLVGKAFPIISPWIGALGAFMSGSNTVSNILFSGYQYEVAARLGISRTIIVALQSTGGAIGNIVTPHNIVAVLAVVGALGKEGMLFRMNFLPFVVSIMVVAILGMVTTFLFVKVF